MKLHNLLMHGLYSFIRSKHRITCDVRGSGIVHTFGQPENRGGFRAFPSRVIYCHLSHVSLLYDEFWLVL